MIIIVVSDAPLAAPRHSLLAHHLILHYLIVHLIAIRHPIVHHTILNVDPIASLDLPSFVHSHLLHLPDHLFHLLLLLPFPPMMITNNASKALSYQ